MTPLAVAAHRARRSSRSLAALVRRSQEAEAEHLAAELVGEWVAADPASTAEAIDLATDAEMVLLCVRLASSLDESVLADVDTTIAVGEAIPSVRATAAWDVAVTVGGIPGVATMAWDDGLGGPVPICVGHGDRRDDWIAGAPLAHLVEAVPSIGRAVDLAAYGAVWRAVDAGVGPSTADPDAIGELADILLHERMDRRMAEARERVERASAEASASAEAHRLRRCWWHCRRCDREAHRLRQCRPCCYYCLLDWRDQHGAWTSLDTPLLSREDFGRGGRRPTADERAGARAEEVAT